MELDKYGSDVVCVNPQWNWKNFSISSANSSTNIFVNPQWNWKSQSQLALVTVKSMLILNGIESTNLTYVFHEQFSN